MLENVEIVFRLYDWSGMKGAREERRKREKDIVEKGKRSHLVLGVGESVKRTPSLSTEQGGADRPGWRPLTRKRRRDGEGLLLFFCQATHTQMCGLVKQSCWQHPDLVSC